MQRVAQLAAARQEAEWPGPVSAISPKSNRICCAMWQPSLPNRAWTRRPCPRSSSAPKVSKALLYHYYPGKDALIFAIIHTHLAEVDAAVEAADDEALADRDRLRKLVGAVLDVYRGADNEHIVQLNAKARIDGRSAAGTRRDRAPDRAPLLVGDRPHQPRIAQWPPPADAGDHVAVRDDELGLYVVQGWRPRHPRGLRRISPPP